jgi:hypothetical protein
MTEHEASRTLVKSPPELWEECSDAESLARHLGQFGEIKITRLEPESAVAWEGQGVNGTVRLEPSGWGTRVTLTANPEGEEVAEEPSAEDPPPHDPEPELPGPEPATPDPEPTTLSSVQWAKRARLLGRVTALFRPREAEPAEPPAVEAAEPAIVEPTEPATPQATEPALPDAPEPAEPATTDDTSLEPPTAEGAPSEPDPDGALAAALDSLGQAHHRPFSRP